MENSNNGSRKIKKELDSIKSSIFSRSMSLAKLSINAGAKLAAQGISNIMQDNDTKLEKWQNFLRDQAKVLSQEVGELKGSLMKAGQMLSMYGEHFFPPEVNEFLKTLQQESAPLKWEIMEKILRAELGEEKLKQLKVDPVSIGSASLGQVHRATIIATNEEIALKIQYPNVDRAIDSDLLAIKTFLSVLKIIPQDFNPEPVFQEVREMLKQETDYLLELNLTEKYRQKLGDDKRFVIPKVYPSFSTKKVLATSFETGVRADDPDVQNLTLERRNKIALNFLELYFKEFFHWQFVQTDPHTGNYKIRINENGDDQIVLLDFGATREYPDTFMRPMQKMMKSVLLNNQDQFTQAAEQIGFLAKNDDPELKKLFSEFCQYIMEPFQQDYDWKNTDLPQRTSRKVVQMIQKFKFRTPPKEIIFLDRKAGGVFIMMSILRAQLNARELLLKYMEDID